MSLLSDVLGRAKQDITNRASQIKDNAVQGATAAVKALPNQAMGVVDNAIGQAANAGMGAVRGAASDLLRGDVSSAASRFTALPGQLSDLGTGAVTTLMQLPGQTVDNVLSGLGITSGFNLTNPGSGMNVSSYSSDDGGVAPGNALEGALARSDPMMNFLWYCEPPVLVGEGVSTSLPWFYVEEANVPFRTYEVRGVYRDGRTRNYASKYTVDGLTLGIYMDTAGVAMSYLRAWDSLIMAPFGRSDAATRGGGFRMPSLYMKDLPFYILDVNKQQLVQILYSECWPVNTDAFNLQSQSSERIVANISFNVGDVFVTAVGLDNQQMDAAIDKMAHVPDTQSKGAVIDDRSFTSPEAPEPAQTFPVQL